MTMTLLPVGTECRDAKHGARVRIRGYRVMQKAPLEGSGLTASAVGKTACQVELLEDATVATRPTAVWVEMANKQPVIERKGAIVLTSLDKLEIA